MLLAFSGELPRPIRGKEQITTGRRTDNAGDHIELARLAIKDLFIANVSDHVSYPPTDKSDQRKQNDFVHLHLSIFAAAHESFMIIC